MKVFISIVLVALFLILIGVGLQSIQWWNPTRFKEPFEETITIHDPTVSSMDLYLKKKDLMCDTMYYAGSMLSDANDVLHPRWCLRWNPTNSADMSSHDYMNSLKAFLEADGGINGAEGTMYLETHFMDTDDIETLYKTLQSRLFYIAASAGQSPKPIQGPVYVILGQAPYYKDAFGDTIHHQPFQRTNYGMNPVLPDTQPPKAGLRLYAHILLPMYDKNKQPINIQAPTFDFNAHYKKKMQRLKSLKIDSNMCKLNCFNTSSLLCGCVNQNNPYKSRCMAPDASSATLPNNQRNENVFADHSMLYRINENAGRMTPIFSKIYYEDIKI